MKPALERPCVNKLVAAIRINSPPVYIHIDRDSGSERHTSSGWDFQMSRQGLVMYIEAKMENKPLTSWQKFTRAEVEAAGSPYKVVRFYEGGTFFTVNGGPRMAVEDAAIVDFM